MLTEHIYLGSKWLSICSKNISSMALCRSNASAYSQRNDDGCRRHLWDGNDDRTTVKVIYIDNNEQDSRENEIVQRWKRQNGWTRILGKVFNIKILSEYYDITQRQFGQFWYI